MLYSLSYPGLFAVSAKVMYTEGKATVRLASGQDREDVRIGRAYSTGDSVRTGKNGLVETEPGRPYHQSGTVHCVHALEKDLGGKPKGVLAVALGSVKIKYDRLTGSEPLIQSVGCVAGVRGTELTVWAGTDGASQFIVDSGLVGVEAYGRTVELGPDEAVVVVNGEQPGDKFTVPRERPDHRTWDAKRIEALLVDPLASLEGMQKRLAYYADNVKRSYARFLDVQTRLEASRAAMAEEGGRTARMLRPRTNSSSSNLSVTSTGMPSSNTGTMPGPRSRCACSWEAGCTFC